MTTTLNRWNHILPLNELQIRMLEGRGANGAPGHLHEAPLENGELSWTPSCDITEDEKGYALWMDLPGLQRDKVTVTLVNDRVVISGNRHREAKDQDPKFHVLERPWGAFTREFVLPKDSEPSSLRAEFKEGVLCIRIDRKQEALPRVIEVA